MRLPVALLLSLVLGPLILVGLRRVHAIDQPCHRSSHRTPTVRGGGLAPVLAAIVAVLYADELTGEALVAVLAGSMLFALIGLAEDFWGVAAKWRLGVQAIAAFAVLPWLLAGMTGSAGWRIVFALGVVVWLVGFTNAFNFMDGINGISVAQVAVAGTAWWAIGLWQGVEGLAGGSLVIALAALGFLPFNFPRASMFLGDVGSYFLGAWLALLAVVGLRSGIAFEAVLAPLMLYLADTSVTLVRRIRRGERWCEAHREHAYQRLHHTLGWSHVRITSFVAVLIAVCSLLGAVSQTSSLGARVAADLALIAIASGYLAAPWLLDRSLQAAPA